MKVAILIDTWFPFIGGGQINAWEIARRIAKSNIQIDIITRNNGKDNLKYPKNLKVFKLGSKSKPDNSFSKIVFLIRSFFFIKSQDYDLIHAHAFLPGITARLLMVFKGVPAVFTVHGTSINTKLSSPISRWLEKFILTQILYSAQITVSRDFLKIKNINKQVFYIPNGVDIARFDKVKMSKSGNPTLIFVGRLHPQKNLDTLINALKIVKESVPNIRLMIVGEGKLKSELERQVRDLKLKENIRFLGPKTGSELINLYKSSHAFILPSIYEGQPLTLLEAWAAKLPVIVSKTGDCQYLVKNGRNGYFINNQYDFSDIARVIKKAFENKNLERLGLNGYNFVEEGFSWEKSATDTLKVYESFA